MTFHCRRAHDHDDADTNRRDASPGDEAAYTLVHDECRADQQQNRLSARGKVLHFSCPLRCVASAGSSAFRNDAKEMIDATRSISEWTASDKIPTDLVRRPALSFSAITALLDAIAYRRRAAWNSNDQSSEDASGYRGHRVTTPPLERG